MFITIIKRYNKNHNHHNHQHHNNLHHNNHQNNSLNRKESLEGLVVRNELINLMYLPIINTDRYIDN